jgi:hypothetical protein
VSSADYFPVKELNTNYLSTFLLITFNTLSNLPLKYAQNDKIFGHIYI